eukprot:scaffold89793_cov63-Phaeocystis_antarctica.AAC.1
MAWLNAGGRQALSVACYELSLGRSWRGVGEAGSVGVGTRGGGSASESGCGRGLTLGRRKWNDLHLIDHVRLDARRKCQGLSWRRGWGEHGRPVARLRCRRCS